ncbi:bifunctional diguanylate cyclase/phosphodiesterase [Marinomonas shanghaiensis]|uniref:bifunctional diguanylate cyclase/phosphodiesterase n=1 Tax=Marinomonas shanghaiensis TaxID=2202418 RepID=UPI000DBA74E0|nr:EAL domain-containing protein [Marinomonas shanghaiensis]
MFNTLKGRMYSLAFLIVSPCYVFIYESFGYSRDIVKDEVLKVADIVSYQVVDVQEHLISSARIFLSNLTESSKLQDPDSDECQQFIGELLPLYDYYVNIGVPNRHGMLTCNGMPLAKAIDVSDRSYIREAMSGEYFTSSGVQVDRVTNKPTVNFAYPIFNKQDKTDVVGAAVVVISLDWWRSFIDRSQLPPSSVAFILDANNQSVATYPAGMKYNPPALFDHFWRAEDGVKRVFSKRQIMDDKGNVQLTFITGVAVDIALDAVNKRYIKITTVFSVLILLILILFHLFFMNSISKPLNILTDLAIRLGRNEKIPTNHPTGVREMDCLQQHFLEMASLKEKAEHKIIKQAQTDRLTGISNRDAFSQALSDVLDHVDPQHGKLAVILLDLDNFKEINDTRGHEVGDAILQQIADRLTQHPFNAKSISRLGGDEFVFLFDDQQVDLSQVLTLAENIHSLVKQPYLVSNDNVMVSASCGVAVYPDDGRDSRALMGAVDQAMYHAKASGRNCVKRFDWNLKQALLDKVELIKDLNKALKNDEFFLVYQPIVDQAGKALKFEALIRWNHPEKGFIRPDHFIPAAEESGLIIDIGNWVIKEAKTALSKLQAAHGQGVQIGVNVSPLQLLNRREGANVLLSSLMTKSDTLNHGADEKNGLIVEITENLLMELDEHTRQALLDFRTNGIQVALDDFGTGYSSLAYIMNYDIDFLKIDQSFVQTLGLESSSSSLCEAIISMAHKLDIEVVAEGVETKEQADLLLQYGCDYLQGYYFAKPLSLEDAILYPIQHII